VCASETNERARFAEGLMKQLTGTDPIKARFLFKEYFEFLPEFKIVLAFNHKPKITGTDEAIWARIKLIPFDVFIPEKERDKHLGDKLCAELPGILAWMVRGCLAWQREGLGEPEDITRATQEYRMESNTIERFLDECCLKDPSVKTASTVLFHAYTRWCDDNKEVPKSLMAFGLELGKLGYESKEGHAHKKFREGIGLYGTE
jgi:putative DNA primase/helicase